MQLKDVEVDWSYHYWCCVNFYMHMYVCSMRVRKVRTIDWSRNVSFNVFSLYLWDRVPPSLSVELAISTVLTRPLGRRREEEQTGCIKFSPALSVYVCLCLWDFQWISKKRKVNKKARCVNLCRSSRIQVMSWQAH